MLIGNLLLVVVVVEVMVWVYQEMSHSMLKQDNQIVDNN
jgi:hypothetical protein